MSRGTYTKLADKVRGWALVLPIFLAFVGVLGISTVRGGLDMYTNWLGILDLGLKTFNSPVIDFINKATMALMPQALTIVCWYIALAMEPENRKEQIIRLIVFAFGIAVTLIDIWFGYIFYALPGGGGHPLLMSVVIDTFFSEIAWTISLGMTIDLFPDARREWSKVFGGTAKPRARPNKNKSTPSTPDLRGPIRAE